MRDSVHDERFVCNPHQPGAHDPHMTMQLLLINPNTSSAMTEGIAAAARDVAAAGTVVQAVQPSFGALSIEGHYDEAFATAGVAEQVRLARDSATPPDAVVIACFGDPGLDAAREAVDAPVLGIAEAAFHAATMLATGFSVVTTMTRTCDSTSSSSKGSTSRTRAPASIFEKSSTSSTSPSSPWAARSILLT